MTLEQFNTTPFIKGMKVLYWNQKAELVKVDFQYGFMTILWEGKETVRRFSDIDLIEISNYIIGDKIEIKTCADLPEYGKYILVSGIDKKMYGIRRWHVCEMNDLEDGLDYRDKGTFFWLTERGNIIEEVNHWCEISFQK